MGESMGEKSKQTNLFSSEFEEEDVAITEHL
jgi:hypothetical protein